MIGEQSFEGRCGPIIFAAQQEPGMFDSFEAYP
jgi:hypothetical protein